MSENRQIARAAGLVSFFTFISRIFGLVRDSVVGYYFGTGPAADAFFVAFRIPNLLRRFVAEGAMSTAFIPVFTDYWTNRSRQEALRAASAIATVMAVGLATITLVGILLSPWLTGVFAPGFLGEPGKYELTVELTRWTFPYIFLVSLVALCAGLLNSVRHFTAPAISPIVLNLTMIFAAAVVCPHLSVPVRGLAYGVLGGGVLQLALQLPPMIRLGIRLRPLWQPSHEAVRRALRLIAPMAFGAAVYQVNILIDTVLASVLPSGSVSYLWYADRVFEFPIGIFAVALGTAAMPSFAAQAARGAVDEMRRSLLFAMRMTNFIVIPAAVGICLLSLPITTVLFERGAFGFDEAVRTANALSAFAIGLWSVSLVRLLVPAFYALEDTRTPVVTAMGAFAANLVGSVTLMGAVAPTGESAVADGIAALTTHVAVLDLKHAGLALSTSIAATVNMGLLLWLLHRRIGGLGLRQLIPSLVRNLAASAAMVPGVWYVSNLADWSQHGHLIERISVLAASVTVGLVSFAVVQVMAGASEIGAIVRLLRERLHHRS
ncbi:MAG TPA: murein biosynthesis integral membrane protein MurJ [Candidatus Acidoferrales bacterium]|nr:murein biosynthesis integral membrane protein MurJ [Candidatus Acidoferrales bacterium]